MRRLPAIVALAGLAALAAAGIGVRLALAQPGAAEPAAAARPAADVRFAAVDVFVDSPAPLAAWQFELSEATGAMAVVGVENGASEAFTDTPHYDLDAVARDRADRIVVADYSLADRNALPTGRTRVATVHVRLTGSGTPEFALQLIAAGDAEGQPIAADAVFEIQDGRAQ